MVYWATVWNFVTKQCYPMFPKGKKKGRRDGNWVGNQKCPVHLIILLNPSTLISTSLPQSPLFFQPLTCLTQWQLHIIQTSYANISIFFSDPPYLPGFMTSFLCLQPSFSLSVLRSLLSHLPLPSFAINLDPLSSGSLTPDLLSLPINLQCSSFSLELLHFSSLPPPPPHTHLPVYF